MSSRQNESRHTVLLGTAGTGTSFGIAKTLRDRWGDTVRIVAADINDPHLVASAALADRTVKVPSVQDDEFVPVLTDLLSTERVDTYFPVLDEEVVLAGGLRERGVIGPEVILMTPPPEPARLCLDKLEGAAWLDRAGVAVPATWLVRDGAHPRQLPCFVKPRRGRGSAGARRVSSMTEWADVARHGDVEYIAQECCDGSEITVDTFVDRSRDLLRAVARERLEVKAGVCTKARVFDDEGLTLIASRVAALLDFDGAFCFQVMRAASGAWVVTDLNPRPGAGTRMSTAAGVDVVAAAFATRWGEDPRAFLAPLACERFVVRQYVEFVL